MTKGWLSDGRHADFDIRRSFVILASIFVIPFRILHPLSNSSPGP